MPVKLITERLIIQPNHVFIIPAHRDLHVLMASSVWSRYSERQSLPEFRRLWISRQEPIAQIEQAHRSISIAHLGNISLRLGRDLRWDPKQERLLGDDAANQMLSRPMRKPWAIHLS